MNSPDTTPEMRYFRPDGPPDRRHRVAQPPPHQAPAPPPPPPPAQEPPAQPSGQIPAQEQAPHDPTAADLRNQVIERLRRMNARHSFYAWERRNSDPLGPHGLAFFYADPQPEHQPTHYVLATATRMFLDGSDVDDLPQLLYNLTGIAESYLKTWQLDPRTQMAQRIEPMSPAAVNRQMEALA